jgi:hypothetical protein
MLRILVNLLKDGNFCLTGSQTAGTRRVMNPTKANRIVRLFAATLVTVATVSLSALAIRSPAQMESRVTLKSIQTDKAVTLYAASGPSCAWFVEMVLPTGDGKLAASRPSCAWFVEMVLPTGDSKLMTEKLQSVAATL